MPAPMRPAPRAWAPAPLYPDPNLQTQSGSSCAEATAAAPEGGDVAARPGSAAGGPGARRSAPGPPPAATAPPERPAAAGAASRRRGERDAVGRKPSAFLRACPPRPQSRSRTPPAPATRTGGVNPGCRLGARSPQQQLGTLCSLGLRAVSEKRLPSGNAREGRATEKILKTAVVQKPV